MRSVCSLLLAFVIVGCGPKTNTETLGKTTTKTQTPTTEAKTTETPTETATVTPKPEVVTEEISTKGTPTTVISPPDTLTLKSTKPLPVVAEGPGVLDEVYFAACQGDDQSEEDVFRMQIECDHAVLLGVERSGASNLEDAVGQVMAGEGSDAVREDTQRVFGGKTYNASVLSLPKGENELFVIFVENPKAAVPEVIGCFAYQRETRNEDRWCSGAIERLLSPEGGIRKLLP